MRFTAEKIFNLIILGVTMVIVFYAFDFPVKSKMLPLIVGIPAFILMLVQIVGDWGHSPKEEAPKRDTGEVQREWIMMASLLVFPVLILVAGISLGVAVFLLLFMRMISKQNWLVSALCSFGGFLLVYGLFGQILHYPLYTGLLDFI